MRWAVVVGNDLKIPVYNATEESSFAPMTCTTTSSIFNEETRRCGEGAPLHQEK